MIKWSQFLFLFFNNLISIPTYLYIGFVSHSEHSLGAVIPYLKQTQNLKEDYLKILKITIIAQIRYIFLHSKSHLLLTSRKSHLQCAFM